MTDTVSPGAPMICRAVASPSKGVRRRVGALVGSGLLIAVLPGCSSATEVHRQPVAAATTVPASRASVPAGWLVRRGPGFTIALPAAWQPRPDGQRAAPGAAIEIGVPYTGQATPPPLLIGFVEREQVGPLKIREQVLRAQLSVGLPGSTTGTSQHAVVAGSTDSLTFDVLYQDEGGTSVLGTRMTPCAIRQRELIVETPGLPKYGFRYAAPTDQFDEQVWRQLVASIVVTPGAGEGASGTTSPATSG